VACQPGGMRIRGITAPVTVLAALALAGLAGCGTQPGFGHGAASSPSTGHRNCAAGDSGASSKTAHCAVTNPQALQQSNESYLQRQPVPAAQVAAAGPLRRRVQRGLRALTPRQRLRPGAVKHALVAAGLPATVYLLTGNDGTTVVNPVTFEAYPWKNEKLCIYGSVAPGQVAVHVAGITEDGSCLPAQGNG
jgi:hypothetical protein